MAYPTTIDYRATSLVGAQPITETSTTQKHPLGTMVEATDFGTGARGVAEFVYAKGVASTAAGDLCVIDNKGADTTRAITTSRGPCGVAMSANVASQYGWYCVRGVVPVSADSSDVAANAVCYADGATAGELQDTVTAGAKVDGLIAQAAESGDFAECMLHYPSMVGNGDSSGN